MKESQIERYKKEMRELYENIEHWKKVCIKLAPGERKCEFYDLGETHYKIDLVCGSYHLKGLIYESLFEHKSTESDYGTPVTPDYPPFWKGKVEVPIDFVVNVKEPLGKEKEALKILIEAEKVEAQKELDASERAVRLYSKIIELYPNSVYSPKAQNRVIYLLTRLYKDGLVSQEKVQKEVEKLFKLYPGSPYVLMQKKKMGSKENKSK